MVEVEINPFLEVFEFAEIDHEPIYVGFSAGKGECYRPIVTVDQCAVPVVVMLPVCERDITVAFFAGEHLLEPPIICEECFDAWRIVCVSGGVFDTCKVECLATFDTGAAASTVFLAPFIAGPG